MMQEQEKIASIFKALSDPKRITIIQLLQSSSKCACEISEILEIAQSKLSYHMKILCESGIVECWYVGKWTHYKMSVTGGKKAVELLEMLTTINHDVNEEPKCCGK